MYMQQSMNAGNFTDAGLGECGKMKIVWTMCRQDRQMSHGG